MLLLALSIVRADAVCVVLPAVNWICASKLKPLASICAAVSGVFPTVLPLGKDTV